MVKGLKRLTAIIAILLLILMTCICFSSSAWGATPHMIDDAGAVSGSELEFLEDYLTNMSERLQFDVVGVITDYGYDEESLTAEADDFYDYKGYGYGSENDGVIFVVDLRSRMMVLVTTGFGIEAITDYYEEDIYDYVTDSLSSGEYARAFKQYADRVEYYVLKARNGGGGGGGSHLPDAATAAGMGGISLAAGAGAGFFSSQRQKSKLKTVRKKTQANSYARRDSLVLSRKQDRFLYSTVAVMPRPKQNNNDHRPGGGTPIHMGSSGVPHGGGHARGF